MKNQLKQFILLTVLFSISLIKVFAQHEFLVTVNPSTGAHTKIDSLPGVKWIYTYPHYTTFDETNHRFIFRASDNTYNWRLFSVNAITGSVISNPVFPVVADSADNVIELEYDNSANVLYGLHWDNSDSLEYLVSINPTTGVFTKVDTIPGVKLIATSPHYTTFDATNHRYIFKGGDIPTNMYLYSIDATTGNVISNPSFPVLSDPADNIIELQYDNTGSKLYGLHWSNSEKREYLVSINPATGSFTKIDSLPGVKWIYTYPHYTTFDETDHRFIFRGGDSAFNWYLYSVDVNTGSIVSSPLFPTLTDPLDNIIELEYDNLSRQLYGLHWQANSIVGIDDHNLVGQSFTLYPNPFNYSAKLLLDKSYREVTMVIYNSMGQVVRKDTKNNISSMDIRKEDLVSGAYFITVICDNQNIGIRKMVIE
jgi:hypothetical protein